MWKRGAISPLLHNIFNISLTSGIKLQSHLLNVVVRFFSQFCKSIMSRYGYLEVFQRVPWASRSRESIVVVSVDVSRRLLCCFSVVFVYRFITKTRLYSFDSLKPYFYIVKLAFTGVYIIFLISDKNIHCGYSLEPHCRDG